jgi:hypothetical protein
MKHPDAERQDERTIGQDQGGVCVIEPQALSQIEIGNYEHDARKHLENQSPEQERALSLDFRARKPIRGQRADNQTDQCNHYGYIVAVIKVFQISKCAENSNVPC